MSAKNTVFGLKGNIVYSKTPMQLEICENGYLVCEEGKVKGVYPALPDTYAGIPVKDYGDRLLIPGLSDLHVHAPQYAFRGLGMDMELLEWLETNTFPEEAKISGSGLCEESIWDFCREFKKERNDEEHVSSQRTSGGDVVSDGSA